MEKKFRYFIAIPLADLEAKHPGHHLKSVRKLLNVKQCRVIEKTEHCDSTISDLKRHRKNPKFHTIQNYLKALGVEFYAFIPADGLTTVIEQDKSEFILVQITHDELMQIRKSARWEGPGFSAEGQYYFVNEAWLDESASFSKRGSTSKKEENLKQKAYPELVGMPFAVCRYIGKICGCRTKRKSSLHLSS